MHRAEAQLVQTSSAWDESNAWEVWCSACSWKTLVHWQSSGLEAHAKHQAELIVGLIKKHSG
jgi:hypothetical protein